MFLNDIIIIGAGASGLMAAYAAASSGASVTVLEKMPRPARKLMITGKGRCNFTNLKDWEEFSTHIHPKAAFVKNAFFNLTPSRLIELFRSEGLESVVERGDRAFPLTHKASDVVDTLVRMAKNKGARIITGKSVKEIKKEDDGFALIFEDGSGMACRKLIVTTGGLSYPGTGSTGEGYRWAETLGHKVTPLFPSLTALVPKGYNRKEWISLKNIRITSIIDENPAQSEFGDLDFTDGGVEGPVGFRISRKCVKALTNGSKVQLSIDLKPAVSEDELQKRIDSLKKEIREDKRSAGKSREAIQGILGAKLLPKDIKDMYLQTHNAFEAKGMKDWRMDISSYVGYNRCVVTAGGISTSEVSQKTMESKLVPGLYLAGEILDIDADTGGYNLHLAFCTGYLAGASAAGTAK